MQPAVELKAKASAQRYGTIDARSVFYLLTKNVKALIQGRRAKKSSGGGHQPPSPHIPFLPFPSRPVPSSPSLSPPSLSFP